MDLRSPATDSFAPLLPPYILGQDDRLFYMVGGTHDRIEHQGMTDYLGATHAWQVGIHSLRGLHHVSVRVQLFRYLDLPTYEVIAGEAAPALITRLRSEGYSIP
jgi:hypothetical protein